MSSVVTIGTSLEAFSGGWRERLDQRLGGGVLTDHSLGGGAWTVPNAQGDTIRAHLDLVLASSTPTVVFLGGPVNDLVLTEDTGPLCWAVQAGIDAALTAGSRVVLGGIHPFTDGGSGYAFPSGWWPALEQRRAAYNAWAEQAGEVEAGVDYSGDLAEVLALPGATRGDARWFSDGLHHNNYGAVLAAEAFPVGLFEAA